MTIRRTTNSGSIRLAKAASGPDLGDPKAISGLLEAWFPGAARILPWRERRTGYGALVSELMLQQTQVSRVVDAFARFMARFPSVVALADADEGEVLAAWQGLGYYRRARLLHRAARAIRDSHGGTVPADAEALTTLPGIGRYTAGAIASIVFGERTPIVDGNVLRVLSRLADHPTRMGDPAAERWAWVQAERLVQVSISPAVCNEALMELGATVCTPAAPRCGSCPLAGLCAARASGRAAEIPAPRKAAARRTLYWHALVDVSPDGILIAERPATGLWARMHQPPTVESAQPLDEAALADQWGTVVRRVGAFTHVTSHRDVEFAVFVAHRAGSPTVEGARRVPLASLESVAFSNAAWRVLECAGVPVRTPPSASAGRRAVRAGRSAPTDS